MELAIGEDPSDPVLGISDLLIHLSGEQLQKKAAVVVEGENLNIIVGSKPLKSKEGQREKRADPKSTARNFKREI